MVLGYSALRVISKLQGVSTPAIEGATSSDSDQGEAEGPGSANDTASKEHADQSSGGRYVELRLHPDTIAAILKSAPNTESRAAWSNGSALPGAQYRVRLVESRAAIINESGSDSSEQDLNVLRRESERWWEERALEIERGELLDGSK